MQYLQSLSPAVMTASHVISAIATIIALIGGWRVFIKTGEPGWKVIVPLYNGHTIFGKCWKPLYFWVWLVCVGVSGVLTNSAGTGGGTVVGLVASVLAIVGFVLVAKFAIKLAKSFGKSTGFGIGLWLLSPIFVCILGFGKAEYIGNSTAAKAEN